MKSWFTHSTALVFALLFAQPTIAQNHTHAGAASSPSIVSVRPQNLSNTVNQVRIVFSDKMINLSTPSNQSDIFKMSCSPQAKGRARWNDDKTWVFDFETDLDGNFLPGGTRCQIELKADVKSLSGARVQGQRQFKFQIDGPNVVDLRPMRWGAEEPVISEDQIFLLVLDTAVDPATVLKNVYFSVDGKASPVGLRFIEGMQRNEILKAEFRGDPPKGPVLLVQAREIFASKSKVTLVWGPGVASVKGGMARQMKATYPFVVREELRAHFKCTRENADAQCSPLGMMEVEFTSHVPMELANKIHLIGADGSKH